MTVLPVKTSSYFCVNTSLSGPVVRADIRRADQAVVIQGLNYLSSTTQQKLRFLGASVVLFSCSGRVRNYLEYEERLRKQAAVQTWISAGLEQMG